MSEFISIFPGQGSQKIGMGEDFYNNSNLAKEMFEKASDRLDIDFANLLFTKNDNLEKTEFTQPAILLVSMVSYALFVNELKKKSDYFLGHSLGEFSALCGVGAIDYLDALELVYNRGLLMSKACEGKNAGMMVLLGLDDLKVEEITLAARQNGKQVWAANYNSDGQIVVAGDRDDLKSLEDVFKSSGAKRAMLLNMSVASHCPILEDASKGLESYLQNYIKESFNGYVVSNVTAKEYNTKEEAISLLKEQLIMPVKYKQSIKYIEDRCEKFIEFGGAVLKGINKKITKKETISIVDMNSLHKALVEI